jgi:hypothetical protein
MDFKEFEKDVRICGQVGDMEYCDKCNIYEDKIRFPVSRLIKPNYKKEKNE